MPPDAATLRAPVDDLTALHARIEALTVRAGAGEGDAAFVKRLEDLLAEGYREALRLDGERRQLDERMEALARRAPLADVAAELGRLGREGRSLDRHAAELRSGLRMLRERFVALGGTRLDAA
jgi:hypothetical protein